MWLFLYKNNIAFTENIKVRVTFYFKKNNILHGDGRKNVEYRKL